MHQFWIFRHKLQEHSCFFHIYPQTFSLFLLPDGKISPKPRWFVPTESKQNQKRGRDAVKTHETQTIFYRTDVRPVPLWRLWHQQQKKQKKTQPGSRFLLSKCARSPCEGEGGAGRARKRGMDLERADLGGTGADGRRRGTARSLGAGGGWEGSQLGNASLNTFF